ncbi:uncharacterized protein F4807DRAFT_468547 [Annulohypoxylon truncatum]|uniref:uncharacterized protein n=1 Tax=Annulohypoxylon truncatum TaxID=327061 RepID=UPI0020079DDD|nr:uncharacterized protein F4807DRAFT_468547 [Annulohypoxylon truncatum]KAI1208582.1 hypothetical protein F4807DRAFT_468547 [Annulohypoxylon truncatum]
MRVSTFFLTTMAAVATHGYKIDPSLPDGIYYIPALNASEKGLNKLFGEPIRIGDIEYPQTISGKEFARDVVGEVPVPADTKVCYDATENGVDQSGAKRNLKDKCNSSTPVPRWHDMQSGIILSRFASSLAFVCNWSGNLQLCAPNEIDDSYSQIAAECNGDTQSGHICASSWKKCYGHSTVTGEICDNDV